MSALYKDSQSGAREDLGALPRLHPICSPSSILVPEHVPESWPPSPMFRPLQRHLFQERIEVQERLLYARWGHGRHGATRYPRRARTGRNGEILIRCGLLGPDPASVGMNLVMPLATVGMAFSASGPNPSLHLFAYCTHVVEIDVEEVCTWKVDVHAL